MQIYGAELCRSSGRVGHVVLLGELGFDATHLQSGSLQAPSLEGPAADFMEGAHRGPLQFGGAGRWAVAAQERGADRGQHRAQGALLAAVRHLRLMRQPQGVRRRDMLGATSQRGRACCVPIDGMRVVVVGIICHRRCRQCSHRCRRHNFPPSLIGRHRPSSSVLAMVSIFIVVVIVDSRCRPLS